MGFVQFLWQINPHTQRLTYTYLHTLTLSCTHTHTCLWNCAIILILRRLFQFYGWFLPDAEHKKEYAALMWVCVCVIVCGCLCVRSLQSAPQSMLQIVSWLKLFTHFDFLCGRFSLWKGVVGVASRERKLSRLCCRQLQYICMCTHMYMYAYIHISFNW